MREGSLEAPTRHAVDWQNPDFYDEQKLDAELRRVFDICHGCRRCFNLCDSFPRLFDLIDAAPSGELHDVKSEDFKPVVARRVGHQEHPAHAEVTPRCSLECAAEGVHRAEVAPQGLGQAVHDPAALRHLTS